MEYDLSEIRVPQSPFAETLADGRRRRIWAYVLKKQAPDAATLAQAAQSLCNPRCAVEIVSKGPRELCVVVTTQPAAGAIDIYGVVIQPAIEHLLGAVETIEGHPRDDWPPFARPGVFDVDWASLQMADPFSK